MSNENKEFEEWFNKEFGQDFSSIENDYYGGQFSDYILETYEKQQQKLDQKDEMITKLVEVVKEYSGNVTYYKSEIAGSWVGIQEKARQVLKEVGL